MSPDALRILMVNDHITFGGGGDAVFRLERRFLERQGFDVYTFSHAVSLPAERNEHDFIHLEGKSAKLGKVQKFTFSPSAARDFQRTLKAVDPHLVHLHLISKYPTAIYPALRHYPTIQTLHGPNLFCATSWGCLRKNSMDCELGVGFKCFSRGCVPLRQLPAHYFLNRRVLPLARKVVDLFLCPSRQLLASARSMGLTRSEYLPLGIDHEFHDSPLATHEGPPVVLFVGALGPQKGPDVLLDAFIRVRARLPDALLRFAGRGDMLPCLKDRAMRAGVLDHVQFLGFLDRPDLVRNYREAHVLAVPSIWKEQFGMIGPEALACGVPCVASNIGGIPEWLHDGQWGYLVPPRQPEPLAERLYDLLSDRQRRLDFGAKGRAFVLENFGPRQYEDGLLRVITQYARQPAHSNTK